MRISDWSSDVCSSDLLWRGPWAGDTARNTFLAGLSILPSNIIARLFGDAPALILNMLLPGAAGAPAAGLCTLARTVSSVRQLVSNPFTHLVAPLAPSAERADRRPGATTHTRRAGGQGKR